TESGQKEYLDHGTETFGQEAGGIGGWKTWRDLAARVLEAGIVRTKAGSSDGEARRKSVCASERAWRHRHERQPQSGEGRGHRSARREAASCRRSIERNRRPTE